MLFVNSSVEKFTDWFDFDLYHPLRSGFYELRAENTSVTWVAYFSAGVGWASRKDAPIAEVVYLLHMPGKRWRGLTAPWSPGPVAPPPPPPPPPAKLRAGEMFIIDSGSHDDYTVHGVYVAQKDFEPLTQARAMPGRRYFESDRVESLLAAGYVVRLPLSTLSLNHGEDEFRTGT